MKILVVGPYLAWRQLTDLLYPERYVACRATMFLHGKTELIYLDSIERGRGLEVHDVIVLEGADPNMVVFAKTRIRL